MQKSIMNYETLLKMTRLIRMSKDPEEIPFLVVESVKEALGAKGSALFLLNYKTDELEIAAAMGLSDEYLNKGPVSALRSIASSLKDGPVVIYDVTDDPRLQYPEAAKKEGIASILSVPILTGENPIGALRVYTDEPWEASLDDVNFVQAIAQIGGMALEMGRLYRGLKSSIEILKANRDPRSLKSTRWTPHEGVPESVPRP